MDRALDRSRSPRHQNNSNEDRKRGPLSLSKQIVAIGRYAEKRPRGVTVLEDGWLSARNLAGVLGENETDIITAVVQNRWNAERKVERFLISSGADGDMYIKCNPRPGDSRTYKGRGKGSRNVPTVSNPFDEVPRSSQNDSDCEMVGDEIELRAIRIERALNQSLDDVITSGRKGRPKGKGKGGSRHGSGRDSQGSGKENVSPVHDSSIKWLAWVMKYGYIETGVPVAENGWARLSNLAEAMGEDARGRWPDMTEEKLTSLIEKVDKAGVIEMDGQGWARAVEPQDRKPRTAADKTAAPETVSEIQANSNDVSGAAATDNVNSTEAALTLSEFAEAAQELSSASTAAPAENDNAAEIVSEEEDDEAVDWEGLPDEQDEALAAQCSKALNVADMDE